MSKKYTVKELDTIIKDVLCNAYEYIESSLKELKKCASKDEENLQDEHSRNLHQQTQLRINALNVTITMINDIIHPAHKYSYKLFKGYAPMLDMYVKNQNMAFERKLVPQCFCHCCDPDGSKSYAKAQELSEVKLEAIEKQAADLNGTK